ncbi:MAG: hypothetical protein WC569_06710, partial [Candidatus Omnitrophota bacterium]
IVAAPIIRTLWGEAFLHYPMNFVLMPQVFYYKQIFIYIWLDGLLSAMAVWMVYKANEGEKVSLGSAFRAVLPKYIMLASFLLMMFFAVYLAGYAENFAFLKLMRFKFVSAIAKSGALEFIKVFLNFFVIGLIETMLVFVIPFIALGNKTFFKAIGSSFETAKRLFGAAFLIVIIPTLTLLPFSLLKIALPQLMDKTMPEITMAVLAGNVIMGMLVDSMVTISAALLFLARKDLLVEKAK